MLKNLVVIIIAFGITYITETTKTTKIFNLNENGFDEIVLENKKDNKNWLFIIYSSKFHNYKSLSNLIKNDILPFIEDDEKLNFGLIDLESPEVPWLQQRLSIAYVPCLLYIEHGLMYPIKTPSELNEDSIIKFLDKEKKQSKFKKVPYKFTIIQKVGTTYKNIMDEFNFNIQEFFDNRNIYITWTYTKTWILFFCFVGIVFITEYIILSRYFIKKVIQKNKQINTQTKPVIISEKKKDKKKEDNETDEKGNHNKLKNKTKRE